jgi:Mg2+-importing ATPase
LATGLSSAEAAARLREFGPNVAAASRRRSLTLQFLTRFANPLVLVLLVASAVSAFVGDITSFIIIVAIVLLSVTLDFVQEYRAGNAAERLRRSVALRATVIRDGSEMDVPAAHVVPGDLVVLSAGDLVPADACVTEARDFFVDQAFLTGESFPVEKKAHQASAAEASTPASVFMGSSVVSGWAHVLVTQTGSRTEFGHIGRALAHKRPSSAFERGTHAFGMLIVRITIVLVLFVLLVNVLMARPFLESFLFAIALAVGLTPELLPMVVSVTLSRGALRMAGKKVIVKRLSAVQDLGAIDILCTDKTGTLTEGRIALERHIDASGKESRRVLELAYLNSHFETGLRSPLDDAILAHETIDVSDWRKIDEVPFDFERRRVSVLVERGDERLLVVKGAPEEIVRLCAHYETASNRSEPLDERTRQAIESVASACGSEGFRLLGIASRRVPRDLDHAHVSDETQLVFCGYAAFMDPPKPGAADALSALQREGVSVKVLTGDNELVARHVCASLGFRITDVVSGAELQRLDERALQARAEQVNVFCRVSPAQKARILHALKVRGHVVGFLGDGINDAPSLHTADAGISVDSAADVAKEAADLVLMEHDLGVLRDGIREGRQTFVNVMKYITMATSSNFGNMFSMAGAVLILPFLPMLPVQILLNNLLYDVSELALPFDRVDDEAVAKPSHWDMALVQRSMITIGPVSSLFDYVTFLVLLYVFRAGESLFQTAWFVESIATQVLVVFIIRTRRAFVGSHPHPALAALAIAVVAVSAALPFMASSSLVGFMPLPAKVYAAIAAIVIAYLLTMEGVKRRLWK